MKNHSWILSILLLFHPFEGMSREYFAEIDSYIRSRSIPAKFSGNVLVAREGKVIFHQSYGMADYENEVPNSTETVFRIASLTKPITAAAILVLQQQSRLHLTDSIAKFIPKIPEPWKKVTLRHLLGHSSGIPDLFGDMESVSVEDTVREMDRVIQSASPQALRFEPGSKYEYTNFNYCLLGYVVEMVSGQPYAAYLRKNVFETAGMDHTFYDDPRAIIKKRADGYVVKQGQFMNDRPDDPAGYAAGGMLSTSGDLFGFDQALQSGKLISAEALSEMLSPVAENYGYGWQITKHFGRDAVCHRGGTHGFSSFIVRYPEEGLFIVVLSNLEQQSARAVACDVAAIFFDRDIHTSRADPRQSVRAYAGDYQLNNGDRRTIEMSEESLFYKTGDTRYRLIPITTDEFFLEDAEEVRVRFVSSGDGSFEMIRSTCGQEEIRGTQIQK